MAHPRIVARKVTETANQTKWFVEWVYPIMSGKQGKSYYATTYPASDLIFLETSAKRRKVANGVATKIVAQVRAAIAIAEAKATLKSYSETEITLLC